MINKKKTENATHINILSSVHRKSYVDVKKAKIGSILSTPVKEGFTLAEVLITLSIVGVVAVLTIPSVMKNYRYKTYAASTQKVYSQLTDAVQAIMNDEMTTDFSQTTAGVTNDCTEGAEKGPCYLLRNYFKVAASCDSNLNTPCIGASYKTFFGEDVGPVFGDSCIRTTNGATICLVFAHNITSAFIDANGPDAPNIVGLDAFVANINKADGSVTDWSQDETICNKNHHGGNNHIGDYAAGCLTQLMNNGWVIDDTKWTKTEE